MILNKEELMIYIDKRSSEIVNQTTNENTVEQGARINELYLLLEEIKKYI